MEEQLKILKQFQKKYPKSHIGGSVGLFLRGIDVKRDLTISDLDIAVNDEYKPKKDDSSVTESSSDDFDYVININPSNSKSKIFFKMDIRIYSDEEFDVISYKGVDYNVSKKEVILSNKLKYAQKGVEKHILDLFSIATGIEIDRNKGKLYD